MRPVPSPQALRAISRWLDLKPAWIWFALACALTIGTLNFFADLAFHRSYGLPFPAGRRFLDEITGTVDLLLLLPFLLKLFQHWPLTRARWGRRLPVHLLAMLLFGAAHTLLMTALRMPLYPLLGFGSYDPGDIGYRILMETAKVSPAFWFIGIASHLHRRQREAQQRKWRIAQLESDLTRARLALLQAQLNPHFLFNSFNLISEVLHEDVGRADRLLTALSDFLRYSLRHGDAQTVPLGEEVAFTRRYLEIMQVRFEDRLTIQFTIDPRLENPAVPAFVMQPLVENALKFSLAAGGPAELTVELKAEEGGQLRLCVADRGPGVAENWTEGTGLRSIRERLAALYAGRASLTLSRRSGGGTEAVVTLPLKHDESLLAPPAR